MSNLKKRKKKKYIILKSVLLISSATLILLFFAITYFYPDFLFRSSILLPGSETNSGPRRPRVDNHLNSSQDQVVIALLGFDRDTSRVGPNRIFRTDTIMIASINFKNKQVSVLNIPRDSYVKISGTNIYDKINHSYYYGYNSPPDGVEPHIGGINTTLETIQDFLGDVQIHEYVAIDMDGAASIIDEIGGIYFDVELVVRAPTEDRRVLVDKGYQLLDGEKFMYYVRYRGSGGGGEWGRNDRQQEIMIELFKQLKSESRFMNILGLYRNLNRFIETDINLGQITALSMLASKIDEDEIKRFIFSGRGQLSYRDGQNIWYLVTDEEERVKIIKEVFDIAVEKRVIPPLPAPFIYTPYESDPIYVGEPE